MTNTTEFCVLTDSQHGEVNATLSVNITDEGIIADVIVNGEVVATWGATAQELTEDYCH